MAFKNTHIHSRGKKKMQASLTNSRMLNFHPVQSIDDDRWDWNKFSLRTRGSLFNKIRSTSRNRFCRRSHHPRLTVLISFCISRLSVCVYTHTRIIVRKKEKKKNNERRYRTMLRVISVFVERGNSTNLAIRKTKLYYENGTKYLSNVYFECFTKLERDSISKLLNKNEPR